ncbi:origin recognition complex subunit 1 isoform X1 [Salmo salar]|uniref:Origin recognition complex subunit 1 n=1 Tax=Salmo salar TaxID=8030 RepID=A0A1S3KK12_SALSA|nr:origin recognition complex subunit 1 isoform X1 [Salmo salar]|eukprot:XP_013978955.1 PREDICTED: origin recognition complex subunit 1 isoform X3 [Salmo salar]
MPSTQFFARKVESAATQSVVLDNLFLLATCKRQLAISLHYSAPSFILNCLKFDQLARSTLIRRVAVSFLSAIMVSYFTRLRVRRIYKWGGRPYNFDRKLKTYDFEYLNMSVEDQEAVTTVTPGQYILIEGNDDDNPFVAKLLKFFGDESHKQKKALVQWFLRLSEVPQNKMMLLGRSPHPQEIFYYLGRACDDEINAESILGTVHVQHIPEDAPFPEPGTKDTLYVKLSWDTKAFNVLDPVLMQDTPASTPPKPALPLFPPCASPAPTPVSRGPVRRALPTPDPTVMRRAGSVSDTRATMSAGKMGTLEAESIHSASKLSASKILSAKRRGSAADTPGVRKKLQLSIGTSPGKRMTRADVLCELLDEEVESEKVMSLKLSSSVSHSLRHGCSLSPVRSGCKTPNGQRGFPWKLASISLDRLSPTALGEQDFSSDLLLAVTTLALEDEVFEAGLPTDSGSAKTPKKRQATPRRNYVRGQKATTPSRRKESAMAIREPALGVLAEEDSEYSPMQPIAMTPRSKRKSAQLVLSRIRKQLNMLNNTEELSSDGDDDCFVPSKKALQISSDEEKTDSEEETVVRKIRGRNCKIPARTPRKTPSKKATPSTPRTPCHATPSTPRTPRHATPSTPRTPRHATPSIPSRTVPARQPGNILEEARARLHVSSVPESLPCREQEFQDIYDFVESKVMDGTGGCMYISGVPGTGKTATIHEVIRCLQQASDKDEIPTFRFIEINGMKMTDPHQAYVQILQKLTGQKVTADHAAALLEKRFSNPTPKKETTVLLVDELDLLWTRKQNVMYNLFDWPTRRHARLVVLTIANTMDLPERIMINRVASRLGLTRMSFQPYSFKQLQQIITSRLIMVKAFEEDAMQLVSRKVAALSGDARRCLDICRRATEICEHSASHPSSVGLVRMSHVMEALDEMFSSSYITAIRCASLQEQLFLRAVIAEFRRQGLEEATFQQVFVQHQALSRVEGLQPISVSEGLAMCQRLGACRLLLLEASHLDMLQRVRLNVSQDDVLYALKAVRD